MKQSLLTTIDNPFDPFDDFASWYSFDMEKGYSTCSHLMRIAQIEESFSEEEKELEIERAIDVIIQNDFMNIYKKLTRELAPIPT
jgi:hypothetical protein